MKKKPPKKNGGAQARGPSSRSADPRKPAKPAGTTKSLQQKARRLLKCKPRAFKESCKAVYHKTANAIKAATAFAAKHHDRVIEIILLLIALALEYRLHGIAVFGH